ncbi:LLM class flavin-dependent oxidoreductase [Streptomyces sp. NPDC058629]|uniref:LLM class flavin-dependent oxidoreductase n=1 Tax=Streptomyces sp. NPDC058629 TaxID=3346565 RepID=UPI003660C2BD
MTTQVFSDEESGGPALVPDDRQGQADPLLARLADRRGFTRYWMNEHHAMPGVSTSSPPVLLSRLTAETSRLRLGAGGIMLPNHPPLVMPNSSAC